MKRLMFTRKPIRPGKLVEELTDALGLEPWTDELGNPQSPVLFEVTDTEVAIHIVDGADEGTVAEVYGAHDASTPGALELEEQVELANEATIRQQAEGALTLLQGVIDKPNAEFTNAFVVATIKDLARVEKGLIRLLLRRFESAS